MTQDIEITGNKCKIRMYGNWKLIKDEMLNESIT